MGIHALGTYACYKVLSSPTMLADLLRPTSLIGENQNFGVQVLVDYDVRLDQAHPRWRSLSLLDGALYMKA